MEELSAYFSDGCSSLCTIVSDTIYSSLSLSVSLPLSLSLSHSFLLSLTHTASRVSTMPEYMARRFQSARIQRYLTFVSLFLYVFAKTSATLWAGAVVLKATFGLDMFLSASSLIVCTGLYTAVGGVGREKILRSCEREKDVE